MEINLFGHNCESKKCLSKGNHSEIVLQPKANARGVQYQLENDLKVQVSYFDVDDCLFPKKGRPEKFELCDYLTVIYGKNQNSDNKYIWVETKKPSDISKSCRQILNAYKNVKIDSAERKNHFARIISKSVNKADITNDSLKLIKREFGERFDYASQIYNKDKTSKLHLRTY